jgi:hypothetical protein
MAARVTEKTTSAIGLSVGRTERNEQFWDVLSRRESLSVVSPYSKLSDWMVPGKGRTGLR